MSNQTQNPQTNVVKENLTSRTLGIGDAKAKDLVGLTIDPFELKKNVVKMLMILGVDSEAIYRIDITPAEVIVCMNKKAIRDDSKPTTTMNSWSDILQTDNDEGGCKVARVLYNALKNKAYVKRLPTKFYRLKGKPCVEFTFNAELLIAFMYDLPFTNDSFSIRAVRYQAKKKANRRIGFVVYWKKGDNDHFDISSVKECFGVDN